MFAILFVVAIVLAVIGAFDLAARAITFAFDKTRGAFARILVAIVAVAIGALTLNVAVLPLFNGKLDGAGLALFAYLFGVTGPFVLVFAAAGVYCFYRPAAYVDKLEGWLSDQFSSRSDR